MHCLRSWRHYLLGSRFIDSSDNIAAIHFLTKPRLIGRQARWQEHLVEFNVEFIYKSGASNKVADALCRKGDLAALCVIAHLSTSSMTMTLKEQVKILTLGSRPLSR